MVIADDDVAGLAKKYAPESLPRVQTAVLRQTFTADVSNACGGGAVTERKVEDEGHSERTHRARLLEVFVMRVISKRKKFVISEADIARLDSAERALMAVV
jgi:uncharacterized protein YbbK (DUF523 family)